MPYFTWSGVDLSGRIRKGKLFAPSQKELDRRLLKRDIALLRCWESRNWFVRPVSLSLKIDFFQQLAALLNAGVLLPDALQILGEQIGNIKLQECIEHIANNVRSGMSFGETLANYPRIFDHLMIHMMVVGQESGNLSNALNELTDYLTMMRDFRRKLRSAALIPGCTFLFFLLVTVVIFIVIIPKFAATFESMGRSVPDVTQMMMRVSDFMRSWFALFGVGLSIVIIYVLRIYGKSTAGKKIIDTLSVRLPFVGGLVRNSAVVYFLRSVALLLEGGMQLVPALQIATQSIRNSAMRSLFATLEHDVRAGYSLSDAMAQHYHEQLFPQDLLSVIRVGEESGQLASLLKKAAAIYYDKLTRSIHFFTTIFQPVLMIILGLLITLLIFAVYVPIIDLSHIV